MPSSASIQKRQTFCPPTYMYREPQLFFHQTSYPSHTCSICNSPNPDTWLHILLKCQQQHIHALRVKRHNKAVWAIRLLLVSQQKSRCYTLMNAGTYENTSPDNTVPSWLLPYTCPTTSCHSDARFKPDILCIKWHPYHQLPPLHPSPTLTIQFIEFTYCNDRYFHEAIANKTHKYHSLIQSIIARGWQVAPFIVFTVGARASTHIHSINTLKTNFNIPKRTIKSTFSNINTIAIHHAMSILLCKQKLENNQPLSITHNHP